MALTKYIKQPLTVNLAGYVDNELRKIETALNNLAASSGGGGQEIIFTRKAGQTARNSTTTVAVDSDFTTSLTAGLWDVEMFVLWKSADAANGGFSLSLAFTGTMDPAPVDNNLGNRFVAGSAQYGALAMHTDPPPFGTFQQLYGSGLNDDNLSIWGRGVFRASTTGDVKLYWAQLVSKATDTIVLKDSYLKFTKLAD
jgi:hypothetical protein